MAEDDKSNQTIIIYAMPGSQFMAKVLVALESRKIPHYVQFVPYDRAKRRRVLPSGGMMVPEMQVGLGDDAEIVSDSEAILHWFNDNMNTEFFPNDLASELSVRGSNLLAAFVWYYNWVDEAGYATSMQKLVAKMALPPWVFAFRGTIVDMFIGSERKKYRTMVAEALGVDEALGVNESTLEDEPKMWALLIDELKHFQSFLTWPVGEQAYLLPGDVPTAADFSVYPRLERLVGAGTASDVHVDPSIQELKDHGGSGLARLWEWHDLMRERHPVHSKGKCLPKSIL